MGTILLAVRGLTEAQIAQVRETAPRMEVLVTRDPEVMEQALDEIMAIFLDNLRRYVAGEPLHHVVDKGAGY